MSPADLSRRAARIAAVAATAALTTAPAAIAAWSAPVPSPASGATALPNGDILFLASPPEGSDVVRTVLKRRGSAALDAPVTVGPGPGGSMDVAANGDAAIAVVGGDRRIRFADGRLGPAKRALGSVVTAPNGAMAAVSCGLDGSSEVAIRAAGATAFAPAVTVPGPDCAAAGYRLLESVVDGRGTVTIAWWGDGLKAVSVTAAGAVSAAQTLDPAGFVLGSRLRTQVSVAANEAGDTVIAWNSEGGLKVARRARAAAAFGPMQQIATQLTPSINAALAVDAAGGVAVPYGHISLAGVAASATIDAPLATSEGATVVPGSFYSAGDKNGDAVTTRGDVLAARSTSALSPPPNPSQSVAFPAVTSLLRRPGGPLLPVTTSVPGSTSTLQLGPDGSVLWTEVEGGAVRSGLTGPDDQPTRPTTTLACAGAPGESGFAAGQAVQTFTTPSGLSATSFSGGAIGVEPVSGLAQADAVVVAPTGDAAIIDVDDTGAATVALRASGAGVGPAPSQGCGAPARVDVAAVPDQNGDLLMRVRSGVRRPVTAWVLITGRGVQVLRTVRLAGLGVTTTTVRMPEAIRQAYRVPERPNLRLTVLTSAGATATGRVVG